MGGAAGNFQANRSVMKCGPVQSRSQCRLGELGIAAELECTARDLVVANEL